VLAHTVKFKLRGSGHANSREHRNMRGGGKNKNTGLQGGHTTEATQAYHIRVLQLRFAQQAVQYSCMRLCAITVC
jgi:hypothetical protein